MERSQTQRTLTQRCFLAIGSLGPLGYLPASGTATVAIVGIPLFWWESKQTVVVQLLLGAALTVIALLLHGEGDRLLGEKDSRKLVWDELVGFWIAVLGVPFTWQLVVVAFLLERGLDILKFPPAHWIERRCPGAWGVVGDDVVAGLYTCAVLHALVRYLPATFGLGT